MGDPGPWPAGEHGLASRGEFVDILAKRPEGDAIARIVADSRPFDWGDTNRGRGRFIGELREMPFATAGMGVARPGRDGEKYPSFKIAP